MSMFENDQYCWRETYFVLFDAARRPTAKAMQKALGRLDQHFTLTNLRGDDSGLFESITVLAPDDFAALDICYLSGDEVTEQAAVFAKELQSSGLSGADKARLDKLRRSTGRFDVLHFEQIVRFEEEEDEDSDGMLDPSALLIVLDTLAKLTDGIAIDPQGGMLM